MTRSLLWTLVILAAIFTAGYIAWKLLSKPAVPKSTGNVLGPINGVFGFINQALNTATGAAGAADRILGSTENIWDRVTHWGEGDTGDN